MKNGLPTTVDEYKRHVRDACKDLLPSSNVGIEHYLGLLAGLAFTEGILLAAIDVLKSREGGELRSLASESPDVLDEIRSDSYARATREMHRKLKGNGLG